MRYIIETQKKGSPGDSWTVFPRTLSYTRDFALAIIAVIRRDRPRLRFRIRPFIMFPNGKGR